MDFLSLHLTLFTIIKILLHFIKKMRERFFRFVYNSSKERGESMSNLQTEAQQELEETMETSEPNVTAETERTLDHVSYFGYSLLRDVLIPELLGDETNTISYWAGKHLARKYPLNTMDEIVAFFKAASWGTLTLAKKDKYSLELELSGDVVSKRFQQETCSFHLESGFVAEQIQRQNNCLTEAYLTHKEKNGKVLISVQWDRKDILPTETRAERYKK